MVTFEQFDLWEWGDLMFLLDGATAHSPGIATLTGHAVPETPKSVPETLMSYVAVTFCGTTSKIRHCVRL